MTIKATNMRILLTFALISIVTSGCTGLRTASDNMASNPKAEPAFKVVSLSEVKWEQLNPARGDKSP